MDHRSPPGFLAPFPRAVLRSFLNRIAPFPFPALSFLLFPNISAATYAHSKLVISLTVSHIAYFARHDHIHFLEFDPPLNRQGSLFSCFPFSLSSHSGLTSLFDCHRTTPRAPRCVLTVSGFKVFVRMLSFLAKPPLSCLSLFLPDQLPHFCSFLAAFPVSLAPHC